MASAQTELSEESGPLLRCNVSVRDCTRDCNDGEAVLLSPSAPYLSQRHPIDDSRAGGSTFLCGGVPKDGRHGQFRSPSELDP